jgi:hypothetical protein
LYIPLQWLLTFVNSLLERRFHWACVNSHLREYTRGGLQINGRRSGNQIPLTNLSDTSQSSRLTFVGVEAVTTAVGNSFHRRIADGKNDCW